MHISSVSMWTPQQKVFWVLSLAEHKFAIIVQRLFRRQYNRRPSFRTMCDRIHGRLAR